MVHEKVIYEESNIERNNWYQGYGETPGEVEALKELVSAAFFKIFIFVSFKIFLPKLYY